MTETDWKPNRQEIHREHAKIRAEVLEIESELDRLLDHPAQPGATWELPGLVETLRDHLKRHFEAEENGGLLGASAEHYGPELLSEVTYLIAQHREFEREIERIFNQFDFDFVPGETMQSCFDGDLRDLISGLAVHEAAEHALLGKLLSRAEGRGLDRSDPPSR